ncbi:hypothetical protein UA08_02927 [Talaromyces atroroseus]|uniref:Gag1-like clamp domain-containing protein n=1 Tax=Talaromyces atroroseus TaxID=1441469 RepID=A0A225ALR9_TALAT|nr:hypothetical protein UA08_02927 [Talaromyces atroroseus]OKL62521.1 hypothetical protein UA08_02927 [Talaromyces atroroseus]
MATNTSSSTSVFPTFRRKSVSKAADAEAKQKREIAVREAKQHVRDVVRADWAFDAPCTLWSSSPTSSSLLSKTAALATATATASVSNIQSGTDVRANIVQWRMREPGSSSESDSELDTHVRNASECVSAKADPYRFEGPDAIKSTILERGRRRRADLEQEMKWNPGLRFFTERRDTWTGAKIRRSVVQRRRRRASANLQSSSLSPKEGDEVTTPSLSRNAEGNSNVDVRANFNSLEKSSSPVRLSTDLLEDLALSEEKSRNTTTTTEEKDDAHSDRYDLDGDDADSDDNENYDYDSDDSMIPVMEPFIADSNYVRSSITPAIYASLYSKVIVQGLTPTIPINLSDITRTLVAGWKSDGQWPPKPTVPPPGSDVPVRRKGKGQFSSKNDNVTVDGVVSGGLLPPAGRKPSFSNQATNAVKKVLALSSHSFHLRRSSRDSTEVASPTLRRTSAADGSVADAPLVEVETRHPHGFKKPA